MDFQIVPRSVKVDLDFGMYETETRYDIADESGKVIDNAQGYGYKTFQSAQKAAWYKFKGGKQKTDETKKKALAFWKANKGFGKELNDWLEWNFKEPPTNQEIKEFAKEKGIANFDIKFVEYL